MTTHSRTRSRARGTATFGVSCWQDWWPMGVITEIMIKFPVVESPREPLRYYLLDVFA